MGVLDQRFEKNFMITSVDYVFNWARKSAIWPLTFGLACCAIEMIASTTSRFDMARFGAEVFRPSPGRCVRCGMPAAAGRTLLRTAEAAGQDRPNDAGEAAHGSAPEAADGGRI